MGGDSGRDRAHFFNLLFLQSKNIFPINSLMYSLHPISQFDNNDFQENIDPCAVLLARVHSLSVLSSSCLWIS
jgi:hypothetical protein